MGSPDPAEIVKRLVEEARTLWLVYWYDNTRRQRVKVRARTKTAPVASILAANPGLPDVEHAFSYVGFKGGEEPGITHVSFVLQRARDGKWVLVAVIRSFLANSGVPSSSKASS
jgi:hypothetical protein